MKKRRNKKQDNKNYQTSSVQTINAPQTEDAAVQTEETDNNELIDNVSLNNENLNHEVISDQTINAQTVNDIAADDAMTEEVFTEPLEEAVPYEMDDDIGSIEENLAAHPVENHVDDLHWIEEDSIFEETPKTVEMSRLELTGDFSDFARDFFGHVVRWIKANHRMLTISLGVCAAAVVVIWIAGALSRRTDAARIEDSVSSGVIIDLNGNNNAIPVPQEALRENAYPEVNDLVVRYFAAMQNNDIAALSTIKNYVDAVETAKVNVKFRYVESYDNINCYTKVGPFPDSYIVYVCYDVKMRDWDITAPSLLTLFVCTNSGDGSLYIYTGDFDENVANYIAAISSQADVIDLLTKVDTEYHEIMDANTGFASYMSALNQIIKDEVGEQLAASGYLEDDTEQVSVEGEVHSPDTEALGENQQTPEETGSFEVQAITTVNVRASDSEVADRLGKVTAGTVLTCNGHQVNGWSEVVFEDQIGYIKTEYLLTVGQEADPSQVNGTVTVMETVNVRGTADVNGEKLGVAYEGESFPLIGDTSGEWTHIIYNGQNAFIKTEFLDVN